MAASAPSLAAWLGAVVVLAAALLALALLWLACELVMRWWIERPLTRDFYGSIPRDRVREHQQRHGVKLATGPGWLHLGWIADPECESYVIERRVGEGWVECGRAHYGSFLLEGTGVGDELRVRALPLSDGGGGGRRVHDPRPSDDDAGKRVHDPRPSDDDGGKRVHDPRPPSDGGKRVHDPRPPSDGGKRVHDPRPSDDAPARTIGTVHAEPEPGPPPPLHRPVVAGPWRPLFRPRRHGRYVNDHSIHRDAAGRWRLLGITSQSDGDFDAERWFAQGVSDAFPPAGGAEMEEAERVADLGTGELAWAPHVVEPVESGGRWHHFWSPHRLHHMTSRDGVHWEGHEIALDPPHHLFFRDAMVREVAPGQWLLYATARGRYYSRVDCYQSFDLEHWQYVRPALRTGRGCERASPFASTESPTVVTHQGRYYLALTYNNDSFFWPGVLMLFRRWPGRASYDDTRVFHSANPYDFGTYRGPRHPSRQVARLEAHAAELLRHPDTGEWWITTAGWPWVATLTSGEVAVAPLRWEPVANADE